jgi:HK97 family phage major capsid protein
MVSLAPPDLLLGKPLVADPFMPATAAVANNWPIAFGDFSQYFVRMVGGVRFERSDDFAFGTDLVSFRAIIRADGQLMNPPTTVTPSNKGQPLVLFKGGATG